MTDSSRRFYSRPKRSRRHGFEQLESRLPFAGVAGVTGVSFIDTNSVTGNNTADSSALNFGSPITIATSANGRFVAFQSAANNLVAGDTGEKDQFDLYLKDLVTGETRPVMVGAIYPSHDADISDDGRYVVFSSMAVLFNGDANATYDVFRKDMLTGETVHVSRRGELWTEWQLASYAPSISADGRYVAFVSAATNLVPDPPPSYWNGYWGIYVRDMETGVIRLIDRTEIGNAELSADGQYLAYTGSLNSSNASRGVIVYNLATGMKVRANENPSGVAARYDSEPSISGNGRFVTFVSDAADLVPDDTNGVEDIFVRDLQTGSIQLVSQSSDGTQGNAAAETPFISRDGRYVTFTSAATNLVSDDTNGVADVFLKDMLIGTLRRISRTTAGEGNGRSFQAALSADNQFAVFLSEASNLIDGDSNHATDVFRVDLTTGDIVTTTDRHAGGNSQIAGNGGAISSDISGDGRYVVFESEASNLVSGDTNGKGDVFLKDMQSGVITLVSSDSNGMQRASKSYDPAISSDGRFVAFTRDGDIFLKDLQTGALSLLSSSSSGVPSIYGSYQPDISADGRYVVFQNSGSDLAPGTARAKVNVYRKDTQTGAIVRLGDSLPANVGSTTELYRPAISADGRYVAYHSYYSNSNGLWVTDVEAGTTQSLIIDQDFYTTSVSISGDGRFVVYKDGSSIFRYDRQTNTTTIVSQGYRSDGRVVNSSGQAAVISADGSHVAFLSMADNLGTIGATYNTLDVFVKNLATGAIRQVDSIYTSFNEDSTQVAISDDGRFVSFVSATEHLVTGDFNGQPDVFFRDLQAAVDTSAPMQITMGKVTADPGKSIDLPIHIQPANQERPAVLQSLQLEVFYDPLQLEIVDVQVGSDWLYVHPWTLTKTIDPIAGRMSILYSGVNPQYDVLLSKILVIKAKTTTTATPGVAKVDIATNAREPGRVTQLNGGLTPVADITDGLVTINRALGTVEVVGTTLQITGTHLNDVIVAASTPSGFRVRLNRQLFTMNGFGAIQIDGRSGHDVIAVAPEWQNVTEIISQPPANPLAAGEAVEEPALEKQLARDIALLHWQRELNDKAWSRGTSPTRKRGSSAN